MIKLEYNKKRLINMIYFCKQLFEITALYSLIMHFFFSNFVNQFQMPTFLII